MKWKEVPIAEEYLAGLDNQMKTMQTQVPVKYKFCCGNIDNKRKAARMKILFAQHFNSLIRSVKESKLTVLAGKIKSLFKFGSK